MLRVALAQRFAGDGVVIDFRGRFGGRLVKVPPQPNRLNDDTNVLVVMFDTDCASARSRDRRMRSYLP